MDEIITFKLKKTKKGNVLLVITLIERNIVFNEKIKNEVVDKYISYVNKYDKLFILINTSAVESIEKKLLYEGATDLCRHEKTLKATLVATSVIMTNAFLKKIIDIVLAITPVLTPTKFFTKPEEALEFIYSNEV